MGKHKKKQSKRRSAAAELRQEEASEELSALSAIFGDDLQQFEGSLGFQVHIVPHPGEARANYVGLTLVVRYGAATAPASTQPTFLASPLHSNHSSRPLMGAVTPMTIQLRS